MIVAAVPEDTFRSGQVRVLYVCDFKYKYVCVGSSPHRVGGSWFLLHRDLIPLMHYLFYSELRACLGSSSFQAAC